MQEIDRLRERIRQHRLTYTWLIYQLQLRGISTDKYQVSAIFSGAHKGDKANLIFKTTDAILTDYEKTMAQSPMDVENNAIIVSD